MKQTGIWESLSELGINFLTFKLAKDKVLIPRIIIPVGSAIW